METFSLLASTGSKKVDDLLKGILILFQDAFPGRIRSCYLAGSYADGSVVATSDLDLKLVFKGEVAPEERLRRIEAACELMSPLQMDFTLVGDERLFKRGHV